MPSRTIRSCSPEYATNAASWLMRAARTGKSRLVNVWTHASALMSQSVHMASVPPATKYLHRPVSPALPFEHNLTMGCPRCLPERPSGRQGSVCIRHETASDMRRLMRCLKKLKTEKHGRLAANRLFTGVLGCRHLSEASISTVKVGPWVDVSRVATFSRAG